MPGLLIKTILILPLIAFLEILNGIFRLKVLNRNFKEKNARKIALIPGSILVFSVTWLFLPWISPASFGECFIIGSIWLTGMLLFDIGFGRFVFKFTWKRIAADFDIRQGNYLALGMLLVFLLPALVFYWQNY